MILASSIRDALDELASAGRFPEPGNPLAPQITERLLIYADETRWAMVFEFVGYDPEYPNVVDRLRMIGDGVDPSPPSSRPSERVASFARVDNYGDLWDPEGSQFYARYLGVPILVREQPLLPEVPHDARRPDLFRSLMPRYRDLFLADDDELKRIVPAGLPCLLQIDQWHHERLLIRAPEMKTERRRRFHEGIQRRLPPEERTAFETFPSMIETYQQLASVMAASDPALYAPSLEPNSHWSNWPADSPYC